MPKMKEQAVYQITVTERQLKLINAALEEFFRIGLNQWGDLAERVANIGFESMLIRPHRGQISAPACCVSLIFSITFIRVPPMYCTLPAAMLIHQIQDPYILVCKSAHTMM